MATDAGSTTTTTTVSQDSAGNTAQTTTSATKTPTPDSVLASTIQIVSGIATKLGVPVNLALAIGIQESGLNASEPSGDPGNGPEGDLFQLNSNGGEGEGLTYAQIANPSVNATTALSEVAAVQKAYPGASPGAIAVLAQRPAGYVVGMTPEQADATQYGQDIDSLVAQLNSGVSPETLAPAGANVPPVQPGVSQPLVDSESGELLDEVVPASGSGSWLYQIDNLLDPKPVSSGLVGDALSFVGLGFLDVGDDIKSEEALAISLTAKLAFTSFFAVVALVGLKAAFPSVASGVTNVAKKAAEGGMVEGPEGAAAGAAAGAAQDVSAEFKGSPNRRGSATSHSTPRSVGQEPDDSFTDSNVTGSKSYAEQRLTASQVRAKAERKAAAQKFDEEVPA